MYHVVETSTLRLDKETWKMCKKTQLTVHTHWDTTTSSTQNYAHWNDQFTYWLHQEYDSGWCKPPYCIIIVQLWNVVEKMLKEK